MPTYEYECTNCDSIWEVEQRITDESISTCCKCSHDTAKRIISKTSFTLTGAGWYADGYTSTNRSTTKE